MSSWTRLLSLTRGGSHLMWLCDVTLQINLQMILYSNLRPYGVTVMQVIPRAYERTKLFCICVASLHIYAVTFKNEVDHCSLWGVPEAMISTFDEALSHAGLTVSFIFSIGFMSCWLFALQAGMLDELGTSPTSERLYSNHSKGFSASSCTSHIN